MQFQLTQTNTTSTAEQEVSEMLTYCRPAGSRTERRFITRYILPLGVERDGFGNLTKRIGRAPIVWSCHTDTVHHKKGFQTVMMEKNTLCLPKASPSSCLGADDTAGVWLMMELIRARVEGLYIFHREEETGGGGSHHMARTAPEMLGEYKFAVALDRKGFGDVITHQATGRCCSDDFAKSLAAQLGGAFLPSPHGIFTDTANYTHLIGECTNISVGYLGQHTSNESLDLKFLQRLRDSLCLLDVSRLDSKRKPGEIDHFDDFMGGLPYGGSSIRFSSKKASEVGSSWLDHYDDEAGSAVDGWTLEDLVQAYPIETADMLEQYGITADDLDAHINACIGKK